MTGAIANFRLPLITRQPRSDQDLKLRDGNVWNGQFAALWERRLKELVDYKSNTNCLNLALATSTADITSCFDTVILANSFQARKVRLTLLEKMWQGTQCQCKVRMVCTRWFSETNDI